MRIPPNAVIPASKLADYLLTARPWDDKSRFLAQVGFSKADPGSLEQAIRHLKATEDAVVDGTNLYGTFYRVSGLLEGPSGGALPVDLVTMESGRHVSFRHPEARSEQEMNQPKLYDRVVLTRDINEFGLKRGDVATLVDFVPHPNGGPEGIIAEITNALSESLQVVALTAADIEALQADEILSVRVLAPAV
jgi:hypothetical protein